MKSTDRKCRQERLAKLKSKNKTYEFRSKKKEFVAKVVLRPSRPPVIR